MLTYFHQKKKNKSANKTKSEFSKVFTKSWKPWQAGIAIGIIAMLAWLSSLPVGRNYPLGVTHGLNHTYHAIIDNNVKFIYEKPQPAKQIALDSSNQKSISNIQAIAKDEKPILEPTKLNVWLILLSIGLMLGAFVSGKMSGQTKLLPKEPSQTLIAILGGLLIGIGAAIGSGCVIGNILSGWAMLSVGTFVFGIATLLANWATTYFYLMGGKFK
ncbi:MAG: putative inner membrane protein [Bacteroidetes bacterium ADurb.BinA245]|nr:MAG: putative inner membrane protein [Bacteroidetes bacterium ADurb.BinA245]